MIVIDLIYNLAILVAVSVLAGFIDNRWPRNTRLGSIIQGLLFGGVAIFAMLNPFVLASGLIFDGRSVVISLCVLFFGPFSGAIAAVMAILMRLYIGGIGIYMGVSVILSSFVIGYLYYWIRHKHNKQINAFYLFRFGLVVHAAMILFMIALPSDMRLYTLQTMGLTILATYPIATVLIGKILKDQEDNSNLLKDMTESENQYRSLVNEMQQGLAVFHILYNDKNDPVDYEYVLVNPNYEKLTGLKQSEIIGKTIQEVFPKTEEFWNERFETVACCGVPAYYENHSIELDRYYDVTVYRPRTNQLAVILTDITERKEIESKLRNAKEQAEAGDRLKTAFMNNISHEIRTPLNGILGFGQMIAQPNVTDQERLAFIDILQSSIDRLINTVTDYMDISLIASGNLKALKKAFPLNQLLTGIHSSFYAACKAKNLEFNLVLPAGSHNFQINMDKELLTKVLKHLLNNAVKFTEHGVVTFGYKTMNGYLEFFVEDSGIGIREDAKQRIFEAFDQEENSNTRKYEGSGLGLPIAKGIIAKLGGKIWLESLKDKGSVFYFNLPYDADLGKKQEKTAEDTSGKTSGKPLVIVAEDDDSNYYYIEVLLQRANIEVLRAKDGNEAVELCRVHKNAHLVLMDVKMPVMNGFEATKQIKSFRADLPVIGVTAYALSGDENRVLDAGFDDYLSKPMKKSLLMMTLNKYGINT
ncbi:MAG: response regulator [Bacteroidales bacterium]|nr:response regulator [Bacteroidales bacterium]